MRLATGTSWRVATSLLAAGCLLAAAGGVLAEDKQLRLATQEFAPFSYSTEEGVAAGPMVEIMYAICAEAKFICRVDVLPWRRASSDVERGFVDGLFPILPTQDREELLSFSAPVVRTAYTFFVPGDSSWAYKTPADLSGMKIGVYGPSGTSRALEQVVMKNHDASIEIVLNNLTVLRMLGAGRFGPRSAAVINRDVAREIIRKENLTGIKMAGDMSSIVYTFGFSKLSLSQSQIAALHQGLKRIKKKGTVKAILTKYGLDMA